MQFQGNCGLEGVVVNGSAHDDPRILFFDASVTECFFQVSHGGCGHETPGVPMLKHSRESPLHVETSNKSLHDDQQDEQE